MRAISFHWAVGSYKCAPEMRRRIIRCSCKWRACSSAQAGPSSKTREIGQVRKPKRRSQFAEIRIIIARRQPNFLINGRLLIRRLPIRQFWFGFVAYCSCLSRFLSTFAVKYELSSGSNSRWGESLERLACVYWPKWECISVIPGGRVAQVLPNAPSSSLPHKAT